MFCHQVLPKNIGKQVKSNWKESKIWSCALRGSTTQNIIVCLPKCLILLYLKPGTHFHKDYFHSTKELKFLTLFHVLYNCGMSEYHANELLVDDMIDLHAWL